MLNQVKIVLVGTTHSGNIGSSARAMKTMGIHQLVLVNPKAECDGKAMALAAGAGDVVQNAVICKTLAEAVQGCKYVIATSARQRGKDWPLLSPRTAGTALIRAAEQGTVAIVFGCESSGLTNAQLSLANAHVMINANPDYSSLNLAQAVQLLSYEVRVAALEAQPQTSPVAEDTHEYPSHDDLERFYHHLETSLKTSGFIVPRHPGKLCIAQAPLSKGQA